MIMDVGLLGSPIGSIHLVEDPIGSIYLVEDMPGNEHGPWSRDPAGGRDVSYIT